VRTSALGHQSCAKGEAEPSGSAHPVTIKQQRAPSKAEIATEAPIFFILCLAGHFGPLLPLPRPLWPVRLIQYGFLLAEIRNKISLEFYVCLIIFLFRPFRACVKFISWTYSPNTKKHSVTYSNSRGTFQQQATELVRGCNHEFKTGSKTEFEAMKRVCAGFLVTNR
jgi:hypothetical protein